MKIDWKTGVWPALRTAGALLIGNAGVTYLLGSASNVIALTMFICGFIIVMLCSVTTDRN